MISESINGKILCNGGIGKTTNRIWDPVSVHIAETEGYSEQSEKKNKTKNIKDERKRSVLITCGAQFI